MTLMMTLRLNKKSPLVDRMWHDICSNKGPDSYCYVSSPDYEKWRAKKLMELSVLRDAYVDTSGDQSWISFLGWVIERGFFPDCVRSMPLKPKWKVTSLRAVYGRKARPRRTGLPFEAFVRIYVSSIPLAVRTYPEDFDGCCAGVRASRIPSVHLFNSLFQAFRMAKWAMKF